MTNPWKKFEDARYLSFQETKEGTNFRVRVTDSEGNARTTSFFLPKMGKRELRKKAMEKRDEIIRELTSPTYTSDSEMCFSTYYEQFYLKKPRVMSLKNTTLREYKRMYQVYIKERIGDLKLNEIRKNNIEKLINDMVESGNGPSQINHVLRHLRKVFNEALEDELINRNPAIGRSLTPQYRPKKTNSLNADEMNRFLDLLEEESTYWRCVGYFMAFTGCRRGEIAAISWDDIDFSSNTIHIRHNAVKMKGQSIVVEDPKTPTSVRDIPMAPDLIPALQELRAEMPWSHYVFPSPSDPGSPVNPDTIYAHINGLSAKMGMKLTPHMFRKSFATLMKRANVDVSNAQKILGHSDVSVTYGHYMDVDEQDKRDAMDAFDKALNNTEWRDSE